MSGALHAGSGARRPGWVNKDGTRAAAARVVRALDAEHWEHVRLPGAGGMAVAATAPGFTQTPGRSPLQQELRPRDL
ncbi:hypothetical protein NDU88_005235 [Pleurodeles waltl]|uniref:Uncharacterized protein n=1 Tax=Pleurodeles waltl TaxID=8319 RepID=A0AAV7M9X6_PLEWA|nr:hypothetical protein NDU88_005235 [Pleurodeles waltl]